MRSITSQYGTPPILFPAARTQRSFNVPCNTPSTPGYAKRTFFLPKSRRICSSTVGILCPLKRLRMTLLFQVRERSELQHKGYDKALYTEPCAHTSALRFNIATSK